MYCLSCYYDLRGSTKVNRCPECGRGFDPNDILTYREYDERTTRSRHPISLVLQSIMFGWVAVAVVHLLDWRGFLVVGRFWHTSLVEGTLVGIVLLPGWWFTRTRYLRFWYWNRFLGGSFLFLLMIAGSLITSVVHLISLRLF